VVSSSHVVFAAPSSSGGGLLKLCPCSSVRFLSRETALHKLLRCESFPRAAALQGLPQSWSLPMGCSPSGTGCSSVGPPQGHKSYQQTCSSMGSALHGSAGSWQAPHKATSCFRHPPASAWNHFHGLQVDMCSTMGLHGCRGTTCLTMVFITSCKERFSALATRAPPPPPLSLILVSAELFLSLHLTPLSNCRFTTVFPLPPS